MPEAALSATLLAFDTSTECMAVAVRHGDALFDWDGPGGAAASTSLVPQIRQAMQQAGLSFAQLQAIAFARGPGAFTGLRTACAVAQGLAFGASVPVLALDSLLIVAEAVRFGVPPQADFELHVAMDARMGEIYAGQYGWHAGRWSARVPPALYTLEALNAAWRQTPPRAVAGSALAAFGDSLCLGSARCFAPVGGRAGALMRLAQQAWADGESVDAALALPLYLRDKVASTVAEREAQRQARGGA